MPSAIRAVSPMKQSKSGTLNLEPCIATNFENFRQIRALHGQLLGTEPGKIEGAAKIRTGLARCIMLLTEIAITVDLRDA